MAMRIQQLREEQRMTQVRLSVELGISQETVSAYEKGKHYPSVATLIQLSRLLHASCDYILGLSDVRYPQSNSTPDLAADRLLAQYRLLNEHKRARLHAYIDGLLDQD